MANEESENIVEIPTEELIGADPSVMNGKEKQGINISGDTVTMKTADLPEWQRHALLWAFSFTKEKKWSWTDVEKHFDLDRSVLYRAWTGKYVYPATETRKEKGQTIKDDHGKPKKFPHPKAMQQIPLDGVCNKILKKKDLLIERDQINTLPFINTSVNERMCRVFDEALVSQTITFVYGESQIGKTACAKRRLITHNHGRTRYVLTPAGDGAYGFMRAWCKACGLTVQSRMDAMRDILCDFLTYDMHVIFDEIHELWLSYEPKAMLKVIANIRQVQERARCGMTLIGTNAFQYEMEKGLWSKNLKQLKKRGIWELQLEDSPTDADLALISSHYRLPDPTGKALDYVQFLAEQDGFGKYTKFLARASQNAKANNEKFTWDHFCTTVELATVLKTKPAKQKKELVKS